jgi:HSP20 family protein
MANLTWWRRPSNLTLQRDIEDILDDFELPRTFRREVERLFDEDLSPRSLWTEMDRMFEDFVSPPSLRRRMARVFEPLVGGTGRSLSPWRGRETFAPQLELMERDNAYVLHVDLPGVREQDVDVNVDEQNHMLTISGERRREEGKRERGYEYTEREYGAFTRSIELPRGADTSKVEANFRNGVLEVHIPKGESARPRKIPITRRERELGTKEEPRVLEPGDGGRKERSANANAR